MVCFLRAVGCVDTAAATCPGTVFALEIEHAGIDNLVPARCFRQFVHRCVVPEGYQEESPGTALFSLEKNIAQLGAV